MIDRSGIIVLDKRSGISSAKAIAELKQKLNLRKIGHAGTLDPAATGILICMINGATKEAQRFAGGMKCYEGTIRLGVTTDSDDLDGQILTTSDQIPPFEIIEKTISTFVGEIQQVPPNVSAVKVNGERAYDLVRNKGISPELKSRTVHITEILTRPINVNTVWFRITCGSGTYIRSIARDLGALLGCGGALATLRRVGSAPFIETDAKKLEVITEEDILTMESIFNNDRKETACPLL